MSTDTRQMMMASSSPPFLFVACDNQSNQAGVYHRFTCYHEHRSYHHFAHDLRLQYTLIIEDSIHGHFGRRLQIIEKTNPPWA